MEEVFRLACRYIGQSPSQAMYLEEIRLAMHPNIGWQRILAYLKFLDGALLIRLIAGDLGPGPGEVPARLAHDLELGGGVGA